MTIANQIAARLRDKQWRMRNLYLILPEDKREGGVIPFVLRDEQETFMRDRHTRNFVPKARKLGMSTFIVLDYLDECIWNKDTHCAHVDFRGEDAAKKLLIAKLAWERGPSHPNPAIADIWKVLHRQVELVKSNESCLAWSNNSKQEASMSFMGGTPRRLHISEYGPLASERPDAAANVKQGSFNAVPRDGIIDIETTMRGGPIGECYEVFELACESAGKGSLSPLDWKLHFFPWFNHPSYVLPGEVPRKAETERYFRELKAKKGVSVPLDRQAWYETKRAEQKDKMFTEFPSTVEECVRSTVQDPIYPEITAIRAEGKVKAFTHERALPMFTSWDVGVSDFTSGWLIQPAGREFLVLAWYEGEGHGAAGVADVIRGWETQFAKRITAHFMPHDVRQRSRNDGLTYLDALEKAGIPSNQVIVVPRTPIIWNGIDTVRNILPRCIFHSRCDEKRISLSGEKLPSGVQCLENYRKQPPTPGGNLRPEPKHDACSHSADAFRTFGEAESAGLVSRHDSGHVPPKPRVHLGS
jgi:hypothetical protein